MRVVGKIERYIEQPLKRRIIEELRPKHKEARPPSKKKNKSKEKNVSNKENNKE